MYVASEKRYDTMPYNRLGASGLKLRCPSACGTILEIPAGLKRCGKCASPHSITVLPTLTWPTTMARLRAQLRLTSGAF